MTNRYPGPCTRCGETVTPGAGSVAKRGRRWAVTHRECSTPSRAARPIVFRTSGGTFYRNAAGRCEDAPCCGCCTI